MALAFWGDAGASTVSVTFSYTLSSTQTTSAGVYTTAVPPVLIRTLWSGVSYPAGVNIATWDGTEDNGTAAPAGNYTIKVLSNNVQYTWEGVIGNTSSAFTTTTNQIWRGLEQFNDTAFSTNGTTAFVAMGYNEGQTGSYKFDTSAPQTPTGFTTPDQNVTWAYTATDDTRVYFADTGASTFDTNNSTFVYSYNMSGTGQTFSSGSSVTTSAKTNYPSCIDVSQQIGSTYTAAFVTTHMATGLAVQQSGSVLAVAHGGLNVVNLFNKTTGASLGTISVTAPGRIAFTPSGDLWIISGTTVLRYTSIGVGNTLATTISGFTAPLAVTVDPTTSNVLVADGGTSQQIKAYSSTGVSQWTYGTAGGYNATNGPAVSTSKFMFATWSIYANYTIGTFLDCQSDGSFWVGDPGNCRALHFSNARAYLGQISEVDDSSMACTVDPNNPTRVFAKGWLEYQFDYTKTLNPGDPDPTFGGNGSWTLVNNWSAGQTISQTNGFAGITGVTTLTLGGQTHTYAVVGQRVSGNYYSAVAELPASGPFRLAYGGTASPIVGWSWLAPNGDLRSSTASGGTETISKQTLTGFDGSGNPLWGSATTIASAPATATSGNPISAYPNGSWCEPYVTIPITSSNVVVSYNGGPGTTSYADYHLGGIPVGGTAWQFQTSKTLNITTPDGKGSYSPQASFGGHNGTNVWSVGQNVIWNYDGQGGIPFGAGFSNQYCHYWDDGLFIGQFGNSFCNNGAVSAPDGFASNYGEEIVVQGTDGNLYAFSADEATHAGIHVWKISNLASIQEQSSPVTLANPATLPSGWTDADVGAPAIPGSVSYNGTWTISGSGSDISGTSDQFNFASESYTGDGSIIACVTSQIATDPWAKAGVMFRDSSVANGAEASLFATPGNGVSFQWRSADGGATAFVTSTTSVTVPVWVKLTRCGNNFSGYYSTDGINWIQVGTTQSIVAIPTAALVGLAVSSHTNSAISTATFTNVNVVLPGGWIDADINASGTPIAPGSASYSDGTWAVTGGGQDIWSNSDQFNFDCQNFSGDGSIVACVTSQTNTSVWAKAGLMFRDSWAATGAQVSVYATPGEGVSFQWRSVDGGSCASVTTAGITVPVWLKLTRAGSAFSGYYSADGSTWTQIGTTQTLSAIPTTALTGLAVTAHTTSTTTASTATFTNVSITPTPVPYSQWASLYFTPTQLNDPTISGATAIPQNDGVTNLMKYLLDINPSQQMTASDQAASPDVGITAVNGTSYLTLTYRQYGRLTGVTVTLQESIDLQDWQDVTPDINHQIGIDPQTGDPIMQIGINPQDSAQLFLRLEVSSP